MNPKIEVQSDGSYTITIGQTIIPNMRRIDVIKLRNLINGEMNK